MMAAGREVEWMAVLMAAGRGVERMAVLMAVLMAA